MQKKLLYMMFSIVILWWIIYLWDFVHKKAFVHNNHNNETIISFQDLSSTNYHPEGPWNWYILEVWDYEEYDITPLRTWSRLNVERKKVKTFDNEEDCIKWASKDMDNRQCFVNDPEDWMWFYMWDSEPRPVFKTYEECEDWAISMRPYSFLKNAKWGVHVVEDWVTRCSKWCHYQYVFMNRMTWAFTCGKTIYSARDHFDYFEKIFDKLEEWRNYERFENAFRSRVWCDIKLNYPNNPVYSYLVWIRFSYDLDEWRANVPKMHLKQKILKDWKTFYVQQYEWKIYVWWEIFDEGYWKVYSIKGDPMNLIFENTKSLFEDENLEIDCHWDFNKSPNDWKELYSLPKDITWIDGWTTDNIYQRLYEN